MIQKEIAGKDYYYKIPSWTKALLALIIILLMLQLVSTGFKIPQYIIPAPLLIFKSILASHQMLLKQLRITLFEAVTGFLIGNFTAILLAVLFVNYRLIEKTLLPIAIALRSIPIVAITPVITLALGRGYATTISIVVLIVFFPTLVNTTQGLRSVSQEAEELFAVLAATKNQSFYLLRLPTALPYLFSALRVTGPGSIIGALVAEWVATDRGIGYFILDAQSQWQFTLLWSAIIIATLMAVTAFGLVGVTEKYLLSWHESLNEEA
ncbi:MetI-like domain [Moorella glycerini]|uniref:Aliphatic sulfonates transport permease protein SsuC n=1 Tax=Neomoorella stamsii TaxID=1266720 RepID=A0A9X7P7B7_9FIRM|nr:MULTISPECIES: ABC transporter permease [Moorella]PRR76098.1 putative aliphatic sulfonates transport permease protein SsuC [Moorella stamsii]CEP68296.1 MetI-like domain [Moorella glycerini]